MGTRALAFERMKPRILAYVVLAAVLAVIVAIFAPFFSWQNTTVAPPTSIAEQPAAEDRDHVAFLDDPDFDPAAIGSALVLHPIATGGDTLVITDPQALAPARDAQVYFTDDRTAEFRRIMLSMFFLSPPGMGTRAPFATLFSNGEEVATFTCYRIHCREEGHDRSLGALLDAGRAVEIVTEKIDGLSALEQRISVVKSQPLHYMRSSAPIDPVATRWPGFVSIRLPGRFHLMEQSYDLGWPDDTTEADLRALFAELQIAGEMQRYHGGQSGYGLGLKQAETGTILTDQNGYLVTFDRLVTTSPSVRLWTDETGVTKLNAAADRLASLGDPTMPSQDLLTASIASFLTERGIAANADDLQLNDAGAAYPRKTLRLGPLRQDEYYLSYFKPKTR